VSRGASMIPELHFEAAEVDAGPGAALAQAMRDEIATVYEGLELDGPEMPKAGATELSPPHGSFIVGWRGGEPLCCGGIKRLPDGACEIKRMYVVPAARGHGVARELLHALEAEARRLDYSIARLDTGPKQPHARALYESEGYIEIENFNGNPIATFFGEKRLERIAGPR
jgi:GNAT superfamily N-acetyltransferase